MESIELLEIEALLLLQNIVDSFYDEVSMRSYETMEPNEIFVFEEAESILSRFSAETQRFITYICRDNYNKITDRKCEIEAKLSNHNCYKSIDDLKLKELTAKRWRAELRKPIDEVLFDKIKQQIDNGSHEDEDNCPF